MWLLVALACSREQTLDSGVFPVDTSPPENPVVSVLFAPSPGVTIATGLLAGAQTATAFGVETIEACPSGDACPHVLRLPGIAGVVPAQQNEIVATTWAPMFPVLAVRASLRVLLWRGPDPACPGGGEGLHETEFDVVAGTRVDRLVDPACGEARDVRLASSISGAFTACWTAASPTDDDDVWCATRPSGGTAWAAELVAGGPGNQDHPTVAWVASQELLRGWHSDAGGDDDVYVEGHPVGCAAAPCPGAQRELTVGSAGEVAWWTDGAIAVAACTAEGCDAPELLPEGGPAGPRSSPAIAAGFVRFDVTTTTPDTFDTAAVQTQAAFAHRGPDGWEILDPFPDGFTSEVNGPGAGLVAATGFHNNHEYDMNAWVGALTRDPQDGTAQLWASDWTRP